MSEHVQPYVVVLYLPDVSLVWFPDIRCQQEQRVTPDVAMSTRYSYLFVCFNMFSIIISISQ